MSLKGFIQNGEPSNVVVGSPWLLDTLPPPPPPPRRFHKLRYLLMEKPKNCSPTFMASKTKGFQYGGVIPLASETRG